MTITIYEVGGKIRDEFLGQKTSDRDFSVEAGSFDEMRQYILDNGGTIFLETPEYLTIRAKMPILGAADYVLCRSDGAYRDGRHPEKVMAGNIYSDLARRDFSCNSIARNVNTGEIIDPYNGRWDIQYKILRPVGGVERSFYDDGLRMFRAFRFAITKGFSFDKDIQMALHSPDFISLIPKQEENRVREEMVKMFKYDTKRSMEIIFAYSQFWNKVFNSFPALWLKPTTENK